MKKNPECFLEIVFFFVMGTSCYGVFFVLIFFFNAMFFVDRFDGNFVPSWFFTRQLIFLLAYYLGNYGLGTLTEWLPSG